MPPTGRPFAVARDLLEVRGLGVLITTDVAYRDWPAAARAGVPLEIRNPTLPAVRTRVLGVDISSPYDPDRPVALMVPTDVTKAMIEPGAELWLPPADGPAPGGGSAT